jgi:hypothetical protein
MNVESNFIAHVPNFKFERSPTFLLACDATGLHWLQDRFLGLFDAGTSFVIGDGAAIASDGRFRLIVMKDRDDRESEILRSKPSEFIWHIGRAAASDIAAKLLSLGTSNLPGHHYLEVERNRFHTIVVTKDEYCVDRIRAMRDGVKPQKTP